MPEKNNLNFKIKSMEVLEKLSRAEMKNVMGGKADTTACYITTYGANYSNPSEPGLILVDGSGATASAEANAYCVNLIATTGNGVYHCSYNCGT
jgi:hypothetical protein